MLPLNIHLGEVKIVPRDRCLKSSSNPDFVCIKSQRDVQPWQMRPGVTLHVSFGSLQSCSFSFLRFKWRKQEEQGCMWSKYLYYQSHNWSFCLIMCPYVHCLGCPVCSGLIHVAEQWLALRYVHLLLIGNFKFFQNLLALLAVGTEQEKPASAYWGFVIKSPQAPLNCEVRNDNWGLLGEKSCVYWGRGNVKLL